MTQLSATAIDDRPVPAPAAAPAADATAPRPRPVPVIAASPAPSPAEVREGDAADPLADPTPLATNLARCVLEVLAGVRDLDQLARWLHEDVYRHLLRRSQQAARARRARSAPARRPAIAVRRVLVQRPAEGVAEVVAIVDTGARVRALAMRLELFDGRRWRAHGVHVL